MITDAPVIDQGRNNQITALAWQRHEIHIRDTWGEYQVYPALSAP